MKPGEFAASLHTGLQIVERTVRSEWLIFGFPIGGSTISDTESAGFIEQILKSLSHGFLVYRTGQDPLEIKGLTDCFVDRTRSDASLRLARAANFCDGVRRHFSGSPKSAADLIQSCGAGGPSEYAESNATVDGRTHNRGILIRRVPKPDPAVVVPRTPAHATYGPTEEHCAVYKTDLLKQVLGPIYSNNAHCSCLVTPDEPHNNCVRNCLQENLWTLLRQALSTRKPGDPPIDVDLWAPVVWKHHVDCYRECSCDNGFITFPAFDVVCTSPLTCATDSAAINVFNRCMKSGDNDTFYKAP
jgi:hypothetical protein